MNTDEQFKGKLTLPRLNFCEVLPVILGACRTYHILSSIKHKTMWSKFKILHLQQKKTCAHIPLKLHLQNGYCKSVATTSEKI